MLSLPTTASADYGSNCVTYVRAVTGMEISGNAGDWWDNAAGSYRRGHQPETGAVLVFRPFGSMRSGHVAVVARVVNGREILVNQANWPHGDVVEGAAVYDVSANNDWTMVRVAVESGGSWGRLNPTFGFIYRDGAPDREQTVVAQAEPQFPAPQSWAAKPWPAQTRVQPAIAQAQPQAAQPQPAQPRPQPVQPQARVEPVVAQAQLPAAQPRPRFEVPPAQIAEADDDDEPAATRHHAAPTPRAAEKAKADTSTSRKELAAAKPRREHKQELADAKPAKAKPDRHEKLEAKAEHVKAEPQKLAKAERVRIEHEKLAAAKAEHKAREEKLAKADKIKQEKLAAAKASHDKAREEKLAKADHKKAEHQVLAQADHEPAKRHADTKTAAGRDRPVKHAHVARNNRPTPERGTKMEQIAEARSGD